MSEYKTFIGKWIQYLNRKKVMITDIRFAPGYPEHFEPYYSIYTVNDNGKEEWYVNLPESEFIESNPIFSPHTG
jgi:hypothetical protein